MNAAAIVMARELQKTGVAFCEKNAMPEFRKLIREERIRRTNG